MPDWAGVAHGAQRFGSEMYIALAIVVVVAIGFALFFLSRRDANKAPLPPERQEPATPVAKAQPAPAPPTAEPPAGKPAPKAPATPARAAVGAPAHAEPKQATGAPAATAAAADDVPVELTPAVSAPPVPAAARGDVEALKKALSTTRDGFVTRLARLFGRHKEIDSALIEQIEEILLTADVGVQTSVRILDQLRARMRDGALVDEAAVWNCLRDQVVEILDVRTARAALTHRPSLILVVGVNGVGKTTTIGKLASRHVAQGRKVLLAAGDTYRAAAALQLEVWGRRVACPVVKGKENSDPGSVIFDAVRKARDEGFDLVIADTAGRLHTKAPLMDELKKVERTSAKALDGRQPDEVLLVLDATTGQNAVQQANMFREALQVTGLVLTKLDGTAKGGVILGVVHEHGIPVRYVGLGERVEDLREFDARDFAEALFSRTEGETAAA